LPQYHPIPENDQWWGKGFTEWTNVGKAKPLFSNHYQPRVPADLGYYDLRLPEVREEQAQMAKAAGIEGFCYYHYWFGNNKQLLEQPFNEVLSSGKPDYPFCLCWANHTWSNKTWEKSSVLKNDTILIEQQYLGRQDYISHFEKVLPAFKDKRYIKIENKPVFCIYDPYSFEDVVEFMRVWRKLAIDNGLEGVYFIGMTSSTLSFKIDEKGKRTPSLPNLKSSAEIYNYILNLGFDAVNSFGKRRAEMINDGMISDLIKTFLKRKGIQVGVKKYNYLPTVNNYFAPEDVWENVYPTILPQWDRTARVGNADGVYVNSTPQNFGKHVRAAIDLIKNKELEHRILFLKSWNEWAEGNYMEPDLKYGKGYIEVLKKELDG
jgi:hypothetical protein